MAQISYEVSHPEYMYVACGADENETLYGCDQDWYRVEWRRRAGCGPVAATNILMYLRKKYDSEAIPYKNGNVEEALASMNDVFTYVRPKRRGLHTVKKFVKGICKFGRRYGVSIRYRYLVVPPQTDKRPKFDEVVRFIEEGLDKDVPVAFLNLHAGVVEEQLSSWHWVTVVGLNRIRHGVADDALGNGVLGNDGVDESGAAETVFYEKNNVGNNVMDSQLSDTVILHFFDQSKDLEVDLGMWLKTTDSGGGFAYFYQPSLRRIIDLRR